MAAVDLFLQCLSFQAETRGPQAGGPNGGSNGGPPQHHIYASHTEGMPASAPTSIVNDVYRCRHDLLLLHQQFQAHVASFAVREKKKKEFYTLRPASVQWKCLNHYHIMTSNTITVVCT